MTARYTYHAVAATTLAPVAFLPLTNVRYSRILNAPGMLTGQLLLPALEDPTQAALAAAYVDAVDELRRSIIVARDGQIVDEYVVWSTTYDEASTVVTITAAQTWSLLRARRARWNATYTGTDQLAIARDYVTRAQAKVGGNLGIVVGAETSGVLRDRVVLVEDDKPVGEAVEQLAAVRDGFDFTLDTVRSGSGYERRFRCHYPQVGRLASATGHVWRLGANVTEFGVTRRATEVGNAILARGEGAGASMLRASATYTAALMRGYPLIERTINHKDVNQQATLVAHARAELDRRRLPSSLFRLTVPADAEPRLGSYVPGDGVRLEVPPGRSPRWPAGLTASTRLLALEVTVPDNGEPEQVALTLEEVTE